MKFFSPQNANAFVFAVVESKAREGVSPSYHCVPGQSIDECLTYLDRSGKRNPYPHPMGRYDQMGRYCTYKPALEGVEGLQHGRFVLHPAAAQEYEKHRIPRVEPVSARDLPPKFDI